MSRTDRFLGGLGLGAVSMVVTNLLGLWLMRFFLLRLGQRDYGFWLIASQIVNYLMLLDLGIVGLLPRQTAFAVGRAGGWEGADLDVLLGETFRTVLWQLPVLVVAMASIWLWLPAEWAPVRTPLGLVFASFVVLFPMRIPQAALQGLQDLAFVGLVGLASWFTNAAVTVGLIATGHGLTAFAWGYVASQAVGAAMCVFRLARRYPAVLPRRLARASWEATRERLGRGMWVTTQQVAQILLSGTDVLIIGTLLGPAAVVPYVCTGKLVMVLANQPQMMLQVAVPGLSEMRTRESPDRLLQASSALGLAMLVASGFVAAVVLAGNGSFVRWWVGPSQYGGLALTALLLVQMILRHWNLSAGCALFAFGRERRLAITGIADGAVTVAASILLTRHLGPVGAPLGSIVGVAAVSLPVNLKALAAETGVRVIVLVRTLLPWLWRFAAVAAGAAWTAAAWLQGGLPAALIGGAGAGILYLLFVTPIAFRPPLGAYLRPRLDTVADRLPRLIRTRLKATPEPP